MTESTRADVDGVPELVTYEDDGHVVVCEAENPQAWIRADTVVTVEDVEQDRVRYETI